MRGDDQTIERQIFGTDGVRGRANEGPLTPGALMQLGLAAGRVFRRGQHRHRVVIGKDTRLSGYMLEPALTAGFIAAGMDVLLLGPLPTPAMAMLTRSMRADLGVMISASHNSYEDNGVKFFGPDGYKLSDETEMQIEQAIQRDADDSLAPSPQLGRARRYDDAKARYIEFAKSTLSRRVSLEGLRVAIDCANGAGYRVAPTVLYELGADVKVMGAEPDGFNINRNCGSTHPRKLQDMVLEYRADIGIALDGDADRVIIVDEQGRIVDGDQIIATIATALQKDDRLRGGGVVSTIMSNMGLEKFLGKQDLDLVRTKVGDRYVVEAMRERGINVGGEPSGHVILNDYATTGDGLVTALQVLGLIMDEQKPASEICNRFEAFPSLLENVRYAGGDPLKEKSVKKAIAAAEDALGGKGRTVIRKSGTEPLIRVMAEGEDPELVRRVVGDIVEAVKSVT